MRNEREAKGGEGRIKEGRKPSHEFFMKIRKPIVNMPRRNQRRVERGGTVKKEISRAEITPTLEKFVELLKIPKKLCFCFNLERLIAKNSLLNTFYASVFSAPSYVSLRI